MEIEKFNFKNWIDKSLGCGDTFVQVANQIKPKFNIEGKRGIKKLDEGIKQLRVLVTNGDIKGQSSNIENIGVPGLKKLAASTTDPCLEQILPELVKLDESVALRLKSIRKPSEAAKITCNLLNSKAQEIKRCTMIKFWIFKIPQFYVYVFVSQCIVLYNFKRTFGEYELK